MGNFLKKILPYAAGAATGGVMSQFGATAPYAAAGSAAAGALTNKKNPLAGAGQGFLGGGVGTTVAGGAKSAMNGGTFGSGAMTGLKSFGNSIPGFGGVGTSNPTGAFAKFFTPQSIQNPTKVATGAGLSSQLGKFGGGTAPNDAGFMIPNITGTAASKTAGATGTATGGMGKQGIQNKKLLDGFNLGGMATGAGVSMLGALAPAAKMPDTSGATADLRNAVKNPSAASQAGMKTYMDTVNMPTGASAESGLANAKLISDRQRADNMRAINQAFAASMPGGDYTNNSAYQTAISQMNSQMDQQYAAQAAQLQFEYDQAQQNQKMAAANALQGMDTAQIQALASLAQMDIDTIMAQTGYDYQKAQAIRDLATQVGGAIMQGSLPKAGA